MQGAVLEARVSPVRTNRLFWKLVWHPSPRPAFRAQYFPSPSPYLLISAYHILEKQVNAGGWPCSPLGPRLGALIHTEANRATPSPPAPGTSAGLVSPPMTVLSVSIREMLLAFQGSAESLSSLPAALSSVSTFLRYEHFKHSAS